MNICKKDFSKRIFLIKAVAVIAVMTGFLCQPQAQMIPFSFWKARDVFTWMAGSNVNDAISLFGTQGVGSTSNYPGLRQAPSNWIDSSGNLWLFGGSGYNLGGNETILSDLWKYTPANAKWTWVGGPQWGSSPGTYGAKGTAAAANWPGSRSGSSSWIDGSGVLWLYGGVGKDSVGNWLSLNDLWSYNTTTGNWTWVSGSNLGSQSGTYGTKGTASATTVPGARWQAGGWIDGSGVFWLFGGLGFDSAGTNGDLNDLWSYSTGTGKWTWVSGAKLVNQAGTYGTLGTGATTNIPGARYGIEGTMDAAGNFWLFGGYGHDTNNNGGLLNDMWKYTPSTQKWTWVSGAKTYGALATYGTLGTGSTSNTPSGTQNYGAVKDSTGKFWYFSGIGYDASSTIGNLNILWKFDPTTTQWTWVSGSQTANPLGTYGTLGTASGSNQPGGNAYPAGWGDSSGNLWFFGGQGEDAKMGNYMNSMWTFNTTSGQWTWTSGYSVNLQGLISGTLGVSAASNFPSGRDQVMTWTDSSGNFWLFGGNAFDTNGDDNDMNDLWKFSVSTGQWTWVSGSNVSGVSGTYGTLGVASTANIPGARTNGATWTDSSGNLWLFGGYGFDVSGNTGQMNDLWKFNPGSLAWTWVAGSSSYFGTPTYGTMGTGSTTNIPGSRDTAASWIDSTGTMWLFGGTGMDSVGTTDYLNDLWSFNPTTLKWTWVSGSNLVDKGGTFGALGASSTSYTPGARNGILTWTDSSNNLWLMGGLGYDVSASGGYLNDLWKYSTSTNKWTWVSGSSAAYANGTYGTKGVPSGTVFPGARQSGKAWIDGGGNLWLLGGYGNDSTGLSSLLNDVWKYNVVSGQWVWVAGSTLGNTTPVYGALQVPASTNSMGPRQDFGLWNDGHGTVWIFGGTTFDINAENAGRMNDLWKFTY